MEDETTKSSVARQYFFAVGVAVLLIVASVLATLQYAQSQVTVYYSLDKKENDKQIISLIDNADRYVYFAIYYFTLHDIADALVRAKERGVVVWGIMDREGSQGANKDILEKLLAAGIPVEVQKHQEGIMHIKALVTDKAYASGSYNWTSSATRVNDEILEIGTNRSVHDQYFTILKKVLTENQ